MVKLIHVGIIHSDKGLPEFLFLRAISQEKFVWFKESCGGQEIETSVSAESAEEAIRLAWKEWKNAFFSTLNCGYCFTLPERDEHGNDALWKQMVSSLNSFNGIYYDEDRGHNCIVHQIPLKARDLYQKLKSENRL